MTKRAIPIIIVLFSLMMVGIIAVQGWWIIRSLKLNEQAFDAAVYRSLEGVVAQTAKMENYTLVKKETDRDSIINIISKQKIAAIKHLPKVKSVNTEAFSYTTDEYDGIESHASITIQVGNNGKKMTIISDGKGGPAIINESGPQNEVININARLQDIDTMLQKMVMLKTYDSISLKPTEIDSILGVQLRQNGLPWQRVDIALMEKNKKYLYKSSTFGDTLNSFRVNLYPNDVFGRNVQLVTVFPDKFKQVRAGIWWAFLLSILFTTAMLFLFMYSIGLLIRHKSLLAIKNDFISQMSHEFKTPLAGISIGADMISEKGDKMSMEQITKVAHSIKEQTNRLNKDVSSVLLSALVDEKPVRIMEPFNLVDVIKSIVAEFSLVLESKNAKVETHFDREDIILMGDKALWAKVISNLLDNSLKFSKESPYIKVNASVAGNKAILEVSDNGIGISKNDLSRIFEKFYRSNYMSQSNIQGFGLGLSFVKKVVDTQGGTVRAASEEGTTIFIEIPLQHG
jgi:two-component system phosphate regulon sensor histidine kinase PhoR